MLLRDILEPRVLRQEYDLDGANRAVALLTDDDLGDVPLVRRQVFLVLRLAIEEQNDVSVLLERSRVVADDAVGEPRGWSRHREVVYRLLSGWLDADDPVPEQIARRRGTRIGAVVDCGVIVRPIRGIDRFWKPAG